jgi:branched-chain amino acid transport system ATP-binding protein
MLKIKSLVTHYGQVRALRGVSLHVAPGEIVTLIGANGAGKTTCLHTIAGLLQPSDGSVEFLGRPLHRCPPEDVVRLGLSLVPEGRQVFASLSVKDNLMLGAYTRQSRAQRAEVAADLEWIYSIFPLLRERVEQKAGTLSGGEQQMLAIGRALMSRPRLLLLDEPSMGLAPTIVKSIFGVLRELNRQGMTILLVEQNARMALGLAHRGYVLETGRVILEGKGAFLMKDREVQRAYLGKGYRRIEE